MKSAIDEEYEGGGLTADEDRTLILGNEILWLLEEFPDYTLSKLVLAFLDISLIDDRERALFNLCPRLDYGGKLLPFKPPREEL